MRRRLPAVVASSPVFDALAEDSGFSFRARKASGAESVGRGKRVARSAHLGQRRRWLFFLDEAPRGGARRHTGVIPSYSGGTSLSCSQPGPGEAPSVPTVRPPGPIHCVLVRCSCRRPRCVCPCLAGARCAARRNQRGRRLVPAHGGPTPGPDQDIPSRILVSVVRLTAVATYP